MMSPRNIVSASLFESVSISPSLTAADHRDEMLKICIVVIVEPVMLNTL